MSEQPKDDADAQSNGTARRRWFACWFTFGFAVKRETSHSMLPFPCLTKRQILSWCETG